ncbi:MAG: Na+/H+ antiporter NhaC family protein [Anaerovoracaceae bacterium]|nr:Na+/H+ antiporter NhaC family protein [Anaerovoracaceae bacterium]
MKLFAAFSIFMAAVIGAFVFDYSLIISLFIGLICFMLVGAFSGYSLRQLCKMAVDGNRDSMIVVEVMLIIGLLTASWRISGTVAIFVYYGIKVITPPLFLITAFLLSCLLSYAIGTSFGVAGTVGVIFMTLARSGGVDPILTAGALMSGVYFGDRCSPVSSSANLVAAVTGTDIFENVKAMMRTALLPLILSIIIYAVLSVMNPITHVSSEMLEVFESEFSLSLWAFLPAAIMLLLPLLKVSVLISMGVSIISAVIVAWLVQGAPLGDIIMTCLMGYEASGDGLKSLMNGGGMVSMLEIVVILLISCCYSGIFSGTGMLDQLQDRLSSACTGLGRFAVMLMISIATSACFCNQTIATLMCSDLLKKPYTDQGGSLQELAVDMENSVILIACMIPWSIGCSVPLSFFDVSPAAVLFAFYMWLVPICYYFTKRRWYKEKGQ